MGGKGSGGMRPNAPQNNPANISASGGNGQSGNNTQAAKYIPGLPYGQGQETMNTEQSAPMAAASEVPIMQNLTPITPLTAPTERPDEHISTGMPFNPNTPGPESLGLPAAGATQYQNARDVIQGLANDPDAGPAMKYLADRIGNNY